MSETKGLKKGGKYDFLPRTYYLLPLNNNCDIKMAKNADIGNIYRFYIKNRPSGIHWLQTRGLQQPIFLQIWSRIVANAQYLLHVVYEMLQNMA